MQRGFQDLDELVMKRLTRFETEASLPGFRHDQRAREMAEHFSSGEKASPALRSALDAVRGSEDRIRQARRAGLTGADLEQVKQNEAKRLFQRLQKERAEKLKKVYDRITATQKRYAQEADADPARSLLRLERAKLRYSDYGQQESIGRLKVMRQHGQYSEEELLVLGSKGSKARAAADDLRRDLPPALASEHGAELLREAEKLVDLPTSSIEYQVEGAATPQRVDVLSLFDTSVKPSPADFAVEA